MAINPYDPQNLAKIRGNVDPNTGETFKMPSFGSPEYMELLSRIRDPADRDALIAEAQKTAGETFKPIDLSGIFDPAREKLGEMAEAQKSGVRQQISRGVTGATQRATEGLAGTGLGRSGVAQKGFSDIQQKGLELESEAISKIDTAKASQEYQLLRQQAELEYSEKLQERGWTQGMIKDAIDFDRQLELLQFQSDLAYDQQSWLDTWGGPISSAVNLGLDFLPVPTPSVTSPRPY